MGSVGLALVVTEVYGGRGWEENEHLVVGCGFGVILDDQGTSYITGKMLLFKSPCSAAA